MMIFLYAPSNGMSTTTINPAHIWRNDITGLRAVAVLPVLLFHAFPKLLPGGFFGVDVFFVISGYLISGIIFRGLIDGTFSYRTFYAKRIKRIIPNLLLVLTFVSIMGYFFLLPHEYLNLGQHIYSSAAFFQNFRLLSEVGYFTEDALRKPLLHLWSLAIEEQFYIVFPVICSIVWQLKKSARMIGWIALLIASGSLIACLVVRDRNFCFYFPLTRFWELGAGILLAYLESYKIVQSRLIAREVRHAMSCIGLILILVPMATYSASWTHPGIITLLPVLGSVLMIAANPDAILNRTLLSWYPLTFVGLISYSLYLWHWPLLSFLFIINPVAPPSCTVIVLILSLILSSIVYRYIENPLRRSTISTVKILLIGLIISIAFGQTLRRTEGLPSRDVYPEAAAVRSVQEFEAYTNAQKIPYYNAEIAVTISEEVPPIIFSGDSHVAQYFRRIKALSNETKINAGVFKYVFCDDSSVINSALTDTFYSLISDRGVKTLVVGGIWGRYMYYPGFLNSLEKLKTAVLQRKDLRLFVLLDPPWTPENQFGQQGDYDPLRHFNRWNFNRSDFIVPYPKDDTWQKGNDAVVAVLQDVATIISVEEYVCPNKTCDLLQWYKDDDHLQPKKLEESAIWLDQVFRGLIDEQKKD